MPIKTSFSVRDISDSEFRELDYQVMGIVFSVHNEIGRLCDEKIYAREIAVRCEEAGLNAVMREVPIQVSFGDFSKSYFMDILFNHCFMLELKTAKSFVPDHRKQAINYILLAGLKHGKLINMRPLSVRHEFVSTTLTHQDRLDFCIRDDLWKNLDQDSVFFKELILDLLSDWGVFLDTNLYSEAVIQLRGGADDVIKPVELSLGRRILGHQKTCLLNSETAFEISAVTKNIPQYKMHLERFLAHSPLKAIQWINLHHHDVILTTLTK